MPANNRHIFHRQLNRQPPLAVSGHGVHITDADGKDYIDACGGAAVSCLGHGHPAVIEALHRQIDLFDYAHTSFFSSQPAEELADLLVETAPAAAEFELVHYASSGSEAVETALKMARQYWVEKGEPRRTKFISRRQSYHGNSLGALAVGGNQWRRKQFEPLLMPVTHVAPCYAYRDKLDGESDVDYGQRLADELEAAIVEAGAGEVIAFIAETVGGATAGVITPVPGYFKAVRDVCNRHGVLLILDEVMCGMGRTGTLHAWEAEGIAPDIQTIAKGLGGGYQPIGAVLANGRVADAFRSGSGAFMHGHTYLGHPIACAAALAVQRVIREEGLLSQVVSRGDLLMKQLQARFSGHPHVGDVRGRGLFIGIELVADLASKQPFDPALAVNAKVKSVAMAEGLLVYPGGGCIDGRRGDHVTLAPPYIVSESGLVTIVDRLGRAIDSAVQTAQRL